MNGKQDKKIGIPVFRAPEGMRAYALSQRAAKQAIGLVPTMGALHEGHLSLIRRSAAENGRTVVSIFVNPIQFDDPRDFARYPQQLESDAAAAGKAGADAVYAPSPAVMYPEGFSTFVDMAGISETLCGSVREAHFRGVCTVVTKLFHAALPDRAYFGQKDAQQLAVVRKMAKELDFPVEVKGCETVREPDGLAMSSRNARLADKERIAARCLYRALCEAETLSRAGERDAARLREAMQAVIGAEPPARIEYIEIVDPVTFESLETAFPGALAALAVYIGDVRLIDNLTL
ncbi:MAG: pantoate--beta-alanine ligase [Clostridiales bacterium]|nr:pantoate--beta-alanine ligase [Clostridiales bacterium]